MAPIHHIHYRAGSAPERRGTDGGSGSLESLDPPGLNDNATETLRFYGKRIKHLNDKEREAVFIADSEEDILTEGHKETLARIVTPSKELSVLMDDIIPGELITENALLALLTKYGHTTSVRERSPFSGSLKPSGV